jgi:RNA polymerase sigma-70 factor (ECF subfamily)
MNELDEPTLKRCRRGEPAALGALYDCYRQPAFYLARRMVGESEAEDVCQEIFIAVFRGVPRFRGKSKLSTWVLAVATKVCLMHLRKRRSRDDRTDSLDAADYEPVTTLSPSQEVVGREFWDRLSAAINDLPQHQRAAITLRSFEDMSYDEIARALETDIEDVRATLFRARRRLIKQLRQD